MQSSFVFFIMICEPFGVEFNEAILEQTIKWLNTIKRLKKLKTIPKKKISTRNST